MWRLQRRSLAPLFSPRHVADFAPATQRVAEATVERLGHRRDGRLADQSDIGIHACQKQQQQHTELSDAIKHSPLRPP